MAVTRPKSLLGIVAVLALSFVAARFFLFNDSDGGGERRDPPALENSPQAEIPVQLGAPELRQPGVSPTRRPVQPKADVGETRKITLRVLIPSHGNEIGNYTVKCSEGLGSLYGRNKRTQKGGKNFEEREFKFDGAGEKELQIPRSWPSMHISVRGLPDGFFAFGFPRQVLLSDMPGIVTCFFLRSLVVDVEVLDPSGSPLRGAKVGLRGTKLDRKGSPFTRGVLLGKSDEKGRLWRELKSCPTGYAELCVIHPKYVRKILDLSGVVTGAGIHTRVQLSRGSDLRMLFVDEDLKPLRKLKVMVSRIDLGGALQTRAGMHEFSGARGLNHKDLITDDKGQIVSPGWEDGAAVWVTVSSIRPDGEIKADFDTEMKPLSLENTAAFIFRRDVPLRFTVLISAHLRKHKVTFSGSLSKSPLDRSRVYAQLSSPFLGASMWPMINFRIDKKGHFTASTWLGKLFSNKSVQLVIKEKDGASWRSPLIKLTQRENQLSGLQATLR